MSKWRCHAAQDLRFRWRFGMKKISYRGYRFPPEIIHQAIWLYLRFTSAYVTSHDLAFG